MDNSKCKCKCATSRRSDSVYNKSIIMNGELLHGCTSCNVEFALSDNEGGHTRIHLSLLVHRNSVCISPPDEKEKQTISFTTYNVCPDDLEKEV